MLCLIAGMMAGVSPRLSAEISLVDRLSDARASARIMFFPPQSPPAQIQTDFLPAHLTNSASISGEPGAASSHSTSNSSIEVDNSLGTLRVPGDGMVDAGACVSGSFAEASAKVIVLTFALTDRSYTYSMTGQLGDAGFTGGTATARLTAGSSTIFEVVTSTPVTLSKTGTLLPGTYKLLVDMTASADPASIAGGCTFGRTLANVSFALDQAPPATPTPTATATPTPSPATPTPTPTPTATPTAATPTPAPTPTATPGEVTQPVNLSTRLLVGTGDNVGIGGFIITGSAPKQVLVRGLGPSLAGAGIANPLADPVLELHGPGAFVAITNNNWRETQAAQIMATGIPPPNDLESAILVTLDPGAYTAVLRGNGGTSGVALVEVYGLGASASKLANISTRGFIRTGNDIVIAGFILGGGSSNERIIIRGLGPSLEAFGLSPVLPDPTLELRDSNGALLISNNNWYDTAIEPPVFGTGLEPTHLLESAIGATLPPGSYTALLSGVNGSTGLGLVEVYDLGSQ